MCECSLELEKMRERVSNIEAVGSDGPYSVDGAGF